jgi:hypothetical protein
LRRYGEGEKKTTYTVAYSVVETTDAAASLARAADFVPVGPACYLAPAPPCLL